MSAAVWILPAAAVLALLIRMLWEPRRPEVTRIPLGEGGRTLRVLLLTDLHAGLCYVPAARLAAEISASGADVLLFAGDACSGRYDANKARRMLAALGNAARKAGMPACAVPGNHDRALSDQDFEESGFRMLRNRETSVLSRDGSSWRIIGLDDMKHSRPVPPSPGRGPGGIPAERTVVLAHNPDAVFLLPSGLARFILSGHFHGGQIWMPFHFEFRVLRHERLVSEGVYRGRFERNGVTGYISRGIGCVVFPFRLASRPELAVVDLYDAGADRV